MKRLRTRVFQFRTEAGYRTNHELAKAMGISDSVVSRTYTYEINPDDPKGQAPTALFISRAMLAFPSFNYESLFYLEEVEERELVGAIGG